MLRPKHILIILVAIFFLGALPMAQDKEKIKFLTPTEKGSTGLFNLFVAETLRQGEFSIGLNAHKFHRDPGDLDFTNFLTSFTVGLHDRIELFGSFEAYKRVHANHLWVNKLAPRGVLLPKEILVGRGMPPALYEKLRTFPVDRIPSVVTPNALIGFYNDAPFMDTGFGDGTGDLWAGVKFNLLSERRGAAFGLAVQPIARFHVTNERQHLVRGLTSGATDGGFDVIVSKNLSGGGTLTGNAGLLFAGDLTGIDRQNRFNWGLGLETPLGTPKVRVLAELVGSSFYGSQDTTPITNVISPIDAYAGLRMFPSKWLALTGGANYHLRNVRDGDLGLAGSDCVGFFAQLSLQRKINEAPTIECKSDQARVTEGETANFSIVADDPDDDALSISWKASGGKLSQQNTSARLDTTGLDAGRYAVSVEASDGENVASCSVDVEVEKRKIAPTVSCAPASSSLTLGDSVSLRATASDANGDALSYAWTVDGQSVPNDKATFEFGSAGRSEGSHSIKVTVSDTDKMTASCDFSVSVSRRPNKGPQVSLTLDKSQVYAGETVGAKAAASDPDNDPIKLAWKVDGQSRSETGSQLSINTRGMTGGRHSVEVTVSDDRGASANDTKSFNVIEKIVIPVPKVKPDNKAKAQLDEIALKLKQNAQLRAKITGHTDDRGSEAVNEKVGLKRADAVKEYLVKEQNIDASRIETASAGEASPVADNESAEGREKNRRVEIELYVP